MPHRQTAIIPISATALWKSKIEFTRKTRFIRQLRDDEIKHFELDTSLVWYCAFDQDNKFTDIFDDPLFAIEGFKEKGLQPLWAN